MTKEILSALFISTTLAFLTSCTENTGILGITDPSESILVTDTIIPLQTATDVLDMENIAYSSRYGYLGVIRDPETQTITKASFATNIGVQTLFAMPPLERITSRNSENKPCCTRAELVLYMKNYMGDAKNPMTIEVFELKKALKKSDIKGLTTNLEDNFADMTKPMATKTFTFYDFNHKDSELDSEEYSHNIQIALDNEFGDRLMQKYYERPDFFSSTYNFSQNVFKGLYIRVKNGEGTYVSIIVSAINIYFRYINSNGNDSEGYTRFAGTNEVVQCTSIENPENSDILLENAANNNVTYLKNPEGVITTVRIPVEEIYSKHPYDTISMAKLTLPVYNRQSDKSLPRPGSVLLVPHKQRYSFFEDKLTDKSTYYITTLNTVYNQYEFANISRMISYLRNNHQKAILENGGTDPDPDWNVLDVIPVSTTNNNDSYTTVSYDVAPTMARLVAGTAASPIKMQVVYSKFK